MKYRFSILILAILALAGCKKDNLADIPEGAILLTTESHSGTPGTKTSVQDLSIQWVNGDQVSLNGQDYSVVFNGTSSYVNGFNNNRPASGYFFSYYPAGLTAREISVTVPSSYVSSYDNGRQVLKQPLVAWTPYDASSIQFLYVTSSVRVLVKNTTGHDLIIDRVEVSSADKQLCGVCPISFNGTALTVTPKTNDITDDEKKVVVTFEGDTLVVTSGGDSVEVQVPILPVSAGNLTVAVYTHVPGATPFSGYRFSRALHNPDIFRNQMMTARVLFNTSSTTTGLFSVSSTQKVFFSQGNLQYRASPATWRFAKHQYDRIGDAAGNTTEGTDRLSQEAWIDLFGYGTSGHPSAYPYMTSVSGYPDGSIAQTHYDWGVHNPISNGGNQAGLWRTLTSSEWEYLLDKRVGDRYIKAGIPFIEEDYYIYGLIIFPDGYVHPSNGGTLTGGLNTPDVGWTIFDKANWDAMESLGAVFLPAAGRRDGTFVSNVNSEGDYWSSTVESGTARRVMFNSSNAGDASFVNGTAPFYGYSVRLVKDAN